MINGAHFLLYSKDPDADRAFFRDVLNFASVDTGDGWLIFKLPPAELALHPAEHNLIQAHPDESLSGVALYLMCNDLKSVLDKLKSRSIQCGSINKERWGKATTISLPSGGRIGLYQPGQKKATDLL